MLPAAPGHGHRAGRRRLALPAPSACALARITHCPGTRTACPRLAAALATAVFTAVPAEQLAAVHRSRLGADVTALILHDRYGARPVPIGCGCATCNVPSWARPFLQAAADLLYLSAPGAGEGRLLAGLPRAHLSLTDFA